MDYPKIIIDNNQYYFLDGYAAYLLTNVGGASYVTNGVYNAWRFSFADNSWSITTDVGLQYVLANSSVLPNGYNCWNLSSLTDLSWPSCKLIFTYNNNQITKISNAINNNISIFYSQSGQLISVTTTSTTTYNFNLLTSSIEYDDQNRPVSITGSRPTATGGVNCVPPVIFTYADSNLPNAVTSIQNTDGGVTSYTYFNSASADAYPAGFYPVVAAQSTTQTGQVASALFSYADAAADPNGVYLYWNNAVIYPGGAPNVDASVVTADDLTPLYGARSAYFFNGGAVNYSGDPDLAANPVALGYGYQSESLVPLLLRSWAETIDGPTGSGSLNTFILNITVNPPAYPLCKELDVVAELSGAYVGIFITVTAYDSDGDTVGSMNYVGVEGANTITMPLSVPATIAEINISSDFASGSGSGTFGPFNFWVATNESIPAGSTLQLDQSALSVQTYTIGVNDWGQSFMRRDTLTATKAGITTKSVTGWGDNTTLPYPTQEVAYVVAPQSDGGTYTTDISRNYIYITQKYSELDNINLRNVVVEVQVFGDGTGISDEVTQWRQFTADLGSYAGWGASKQYKLYDNIWTDGFADPPDEHWVLQNEVATRSGRGVPTSTVDIYGATSSQALSADGSISVASFQNADVASDQAGWIAFEAYEDKSGWSWTDGAEIVEGSSYTGQSCLSGESFSLQVNKFSPVAQCAYFAQAFVLLQPGATCELAFYDSSNGGVGASTTIAYDADNPGWRDIQCFNTAPADGQTPSLKLIGKGLVDNVIFAPVSGGGVGRVWNPALTGITAQVGPNAAVSRSYLSSFGAPIAGANPGGALAGVAISYSSVLGQYWLTSSYAFSADQPNQQLTAASPAQGNWDPFTSQTTTLFPAANLTNMEMQSNHTLNVNASASTSAPATGVASVAPASDDFLVVCEILLKSALSGGQSLGLTVSYVAPAESGATMVFFGFQNQSLVVMETPTGTVLATQDFANPPDSMVLSLLVRGGTRLYAYASGRLFFEIELNAAIGAAVGAYSTQPGSAFFNFGLLSPPTLANTTTDGFANPLQSLSSIDADTAHVSQALRSDDLCRPLAGTLGTSLSSSGLSPISGFAEIDGAAENLQLTADSTINGYWGEDYAQAPFASSVLHYNAPTAAVGSRGGGGAFTAGNEGAVDYVYGPYDNINQEEFDFPTGEYLLSTSENPTGAQVTTIASPTGQIAARIRTDDVNNISLVTSSAYQSNLQKMAVYYPSSWTTGSNTEVYRTTWAYTFYGPAFLTNSTNTGDTLYGYNTANQVRLSQIDADLLNVDTPFCVYNKYDNLGRLIESGVWNGNIQSVPQSDINNPAWPTDGTPLKTVVWDWTTQTSPDNPTLGRIVAASAVLPDGASVLQQAFTYDQSGQTVGVLATLSSDGASTNVYNLTMGYDGLGRLVSQSEAVSGYDVVYGYDELGRVTSVGSSSQPTLYATYVYENGKITESLLNGKLVRVYVANSLGEIASISDAYFTEELYYQTRADGSAGYMSGQIASAAYTYAAQCVTSGGAPIGSYTEEYYYDKFGRLTSAVSSLGEDYSFGVAYDANGNIKSLTDGDDANPTVFTYYDDTDKLQSSSEGPTYGYDASGRLTGIQPDSDAGPTNLSYDPLTSQPTTIQNDQTKVSFGYDAFGWRACRTAAPIDNSTAATTWCVRDQSGRVLAETNGKAATALYIYGPTGLIAMLPQDGSGGASDTLYLILTDHLGSPRVVVDASNGSAAAWYNYDPYGELYAGLSNGGKVGLNYLYTGQELDPDFAVYDFNARLYDPHICRFYTPDPLHQFASPYIYVNNPISFEDPTGEWFGWDDAIAVGAGALVGGGLELLREAVAGEKIDPWKIGGAAVVGAAACELALYTAGASAAATGGGWAALEAASASVGAAMAESAEMGAVWGAGQGVVDYASGSGNSLLYDVSHGALEGAIEWAQYGLLEAGVAPAVGAMATGESIVGSAANTAIETRLAGDPVLRTKVNVASNVWVSVTYSAALQRSPEDAVSDFGQAVGVGLFLGTFPEAYPSAREGVRSLAQAGWSRFHAASGRIWRRMPIGGTPIAV